MKNKTERPEDKRTGKETPPIGGRMRAASAVKPKKCGKAGKESEKEPEKRREERPAKADGRPGQSGKRPEETYAGTRPGMEGPEGEKVSASEEFRREERHLEACRELIRDNIRLYEEKERAYRSEVTQLFQAVKKGEGDSYGQLVAGQNILEHTQDALRNNRAALAKAYFGRIDYEDRSFHQKECCYIGKHGITRNQTEVVVVDWRAPVSSVYYENELGEGSYEVPGAEAVSISLKRKRTYDIAEGKLLGYYDDDVAANDELLVKYLSQNKEAVLGDIIATIQKEQNEIIRESPFKNIIVQGVAGSGKTTVALHRISYLLYNYGDRYKPSEFCIVGSSDMLLDYIGSGLPELDVRNVRQMRMDVFLPYLMGKAWKKKYRISGDRAEAPVKSRLSFVRKLEAFLEEKRAQCLALADVTDETIGLLLSKESLRGTAEAESGRSLPMLERLLNERLCARIRFLCTDQDAELAREKQKAYKKYFDSGKQRWTEPALYLEFLKRLEETEGISFAQTAAGVREGSFDLYDAAALALIWRRLLMKKESDEFSQIVIDEAQDFGEMIYYVMRRLLPGCYFTVMGDVSQNIRFETGMNDWEGLREILFERERDSFHLLAKSYRNTIEISECAGRILERASQGSYKIQPVIRRGRPVAVHLAQTEEALKEALARTVEEVKRRGYETIAVICRNEQETEEVCGCLGLEPEESRRFHSGLMVLPVTLTKGLEFDAVLLWKPDGLRYGENPAEAKLLYVAVTRALHELHLLADRELSGCFGEMGTGQESFFRS